MTVTSRSAVFSGNRSAAPVIPLSARNLDGWAVIAPPVNGVSATVLQANLPFAPSLFGASFTYLRADVVVDSMATRTLIDPLFLPTGYDYDPAGDQFANISAGADYRQWCVSVDAIPADGNNYYFEAATLSNGTDLDGHIGVVKESLVAANFNVGANAIELSGAAGYRGNGTIWANLAQQVNLGSGFRYSNGSRVRIVFNPSSGAMWVGVDNVWHRDPVFDTPSYVLPDAGAAFRVSLQARNVGDRVLLLGREQQFRFATPSGSFPLKS